MPKVILFKEQIIVCIGGLPFSGKNKHGELLKIYIESNTSISRTLSYDNGEELRKTSKDLNFTDHMRTILNDSMNTAGETVPAMITTGIMNQFFLENNDGNTNFIPIGPFRNSGESDLFVKFTDKCFQGVPRYFIRLNIPEDVVWERFNSEKRSGRDDDKRDKLKKRIRAYRDTNKNYDEIEEGSDFTFLNVDGNRHMKDVQEEIRQKLSFCEDKELFKGSFSKV